ncbi:hypothetical protein ZWY2020_051247 [Hordeum vulgare]|nr:hypothetical protein ZWY2020_051247 [Hordeum vulgare]
MAQPTVAGNNGAGGLGKTLAQAMEDLVAEMSKTAENHEKVNAELAKLTEEMATIQHEIKVEATRIASQQPQIAIEIERLRVQGWRLERQQCNSDAVHHRRHRNRLPTDINPTQLFDNPHTPGMEPNQPWRVTQQVDPAQPPTNLQSPQPTPAQPSHFQTPLGQFSNPIDNVLPAIRNLESLTIHGNSLAKGSFQQQLHPGGSQQQNDNGGFQNNPKQLNSEQYYVFTTNACKRDKKVKHRALSIAELALSRYLNWSEKPVTWSRDDHPARVDNPDDLSVVVAPQVGGYTLTNVLMDGGSSIHIL